jgi:hypothetical protein
LLKIPTASFSTFNDKLSAQLLVFAQGGLLLFVRKLLEKRAIDKINKTPDKKAK